MLDPLLGFHWLQIRLPGLTSQPLHLGFFADAVHMCLVQLVVEDVEPAPGKVTEGGKKTDDNSLSNKRLTVATPAAVEST
ncbi:hypothetical protein GUJ93_ZPchr0458g22833 [Zizania palustris]|uniref:Uncharacterized protein n=1 Tax=Zizania palustris TaxID=103762 RepID=A0A8J5R722_ZIZPA|nr:hypothetical protein GUJ93_ZPchr0458g22833 [Zizania palustris]